MDFRAVVKAGVPVATALWSEVQEVPDGSEQVDAALLNVGCHPRMRRVKVAQRAVGVAGENGNGRVLMPFAVFAAEVVLEGVAPGAEQAQLVPAARASVSAQSGEVGGSDHGEVEILSEMMGDAVGAVEPGGAHGASFGLPLSKHEVIDDERAIGTARVKSSLRRMVRTGASPALRSRGPSSNCIVLDWSPFGKMAAQFGHAFALTHELDFRKAKLLALG